MYTRTDTEGVHVEAFPSSLASGSVASARVSGVSSPHTK